MKIGFVYFNQTYFVTEIIYYSNEALIRCIASLISFSEAA